MLFLGEFQFVSDLCGKLSGDNFFRGDNFFWRVARSNTEPTTNQPTEAKA